MMTAFDIDHMSELDRLETLDALFAHRYPADRQYAAASEELGVHYKTIAAWRKKPMSIPHPVLLYLSLASGLEPYKAEPRAQLARHMLAAADRMEAASAHFAAAAKLLAV